MVERLTYLKSKEELVEVWRPPNQETLAWLTKQVFIRHAPTLFNELGLLQGSLNPSLSETGKEAARKIAQELLENNFQPTVIYSSPLQRALQTAKIIQTRLQPPLPLTVVSGLREYAFGEFESGKICDLQADPVHQAWLKDPANYQLTQHRPLNAEPFFAFIQRVGNSFSSMATQQKSINGPALIITHATVIKAADFILSLAQKHSTVSIQEILEQSPYFFYDHTGKFRSAPHGLVTLTSGNFA